MGKLVNLITIPYTQDITIMYLWISFITLFISVILFQFALHDMDTLLMGFWYADGYSEPIDLCGESADYFNLGNCSTGYSYILSIVALMTLNLTYNIFKVIVHGNQRKQFLDVGTKSASETKESDAMTIVIDPSNVDHSHTVVYMKNRDQYDDGYGIEPLELNHL